jgi:uncharacterized protein (DUF2235 family)
MKSIVVFSDGTGNSSAKFFKTNVYRLYTAIDTADVPEGADRPLQVVAYDSGVGTSSFRPLALLGGAFGIGLKDNVLDLYRFICRHYEAGDQIYAFGFSRGAFTIRLLIGLIAEIGVVKADDKVVLDALTADAYRKFRRCFRLSGNREMVDQNGESKGFNLTDTMVNFLRNRRDAWIRRRRKRSGLPVLGSPGSAPVLAIESVAFVGVWDTVAAYGSPIAEITKGIDRWIWPLSMPNYKLSDKVKCARHALALDDERDTFHPLLWDEVHERSVVSDPDKGIAPDRLRQVWFTGMHSDVGGGYSDDSLAYVSLVWMAEEAVRRGLRLKVGALDEFRRTANPYGPMHDSRSGLGAYYRYQPRKISARLEQPDPRTLIQQDPDLKGRGLLTLVRVHESVVARILQGTDHYAPIVLPGNYEVVGNGGITMPIPENHPERRAISQERVWDDVWRRRVNYFCTLIATAWILLLPFLPRSVESCVGPQCFLSPVITFVGSWLPDFLAPWFAGYAARPGLFLISLVVIYLLMRRATRLETGLRDRMHRLFKFSCSPKSDAGDQVDKEGRKSTFVHRLRSSAAYQAAFRALKWNVGPAAAATVLYAAGLFIVSTVLLLALAGVHRGHMSWAEYTLAYCADASPRAALGNKPDGTMHSTATFEIKDICSRQPFSVEAGKRYRLTLNLNTSWQDKDWLDKSVHTSPAGFDSEQFPWYLRPWAWVLRRSFNDPWFSPIVAIENGGKSSGGMFGVHMKQLDPRAPLYSGYFTAPARGDLVLAVNDAVFLWGGNDKQFYDDKDVGLNSGTATVQLDECTDDSLVPCD